MIKRKDRPKGRSKSHRGPWSKFSFSREMRLLTLAATVIFVHVLHVQATIGPPGITSSMPPPPALSSPTYNPEVVPTMEAPPSNTTELAIVTQFENLRVNAKTVLPSGSGERPRSKSQFTMPYYYSNNNNNNINNNTLF